MFKFERFGGFNNKKNHIVQFKTRDKTLSPSILGVTSPARNLLSTPSYPSSPSSNVDLFEFPPHLNSLIKPSTPTLDRNSLIIESRTEQNKKVSFIQSKKVSPTPTPQQSTPTSTPLQPITNEFKKVEKEEEEEDIDDGIFDFPDMEESKEIKLMVASSRSIIDKKTPRKPKAKNNKKKTPSLKSSTSSDTSTKKANNTKASKKKSNTSLSDPIVKQPKDVNTQSSRQPFSKQQQAFQRQQQQQQQRQLQQQQLQQQAEEDSIFDIFQFDFNPTVHIRHSSANNDYAPPQQSYTFNNSHQTPITYNYNTTSSNIPQPVYNNNNAMYHNNQNLMPFQPQYNHHSNPMMSIDSVLLSDPVAFQQVNDFLSETPAPPAPQPLANISNTQTPPQPKKRKRNLVAQLKSASGETTKGNKGFDFLSDEEESLQLNSEASDIVPFREFIQKERSTSPELTYNERMELELEAMMRSEFKDESNTLIDKALQLDEEKQQPQPQQRRPRYQPQNKLNVKFTFEKKK